MFYIVLFIFSLGTSALAILALKHLAVKYNIMIDKPGGRKIHSVPIPRNGGIGIALASLTAIAVGFAARQYMQVVELRSLIGIVLGGMLIVSLGIIDDVRELKPYQKFLGQIIAASLLILFDIRIRTLTVPFWRPVDLPLGVGVFMTVFWILAVTNALNFIDGMDGLAGGIALIASVVLFSMAISEGNVSAAIVTIALMGSCSGFLIYNFPPASIFMGDCGSMFLGFTLALISIQHSYKSSVASILIPVTVLAVPLADTFMAIVRRLWNGLSPFCADRGHIHHRLLDLGLSMRAAVMILYGLCIILGIITLSTTLMNGNAAAIITTITGVCLLSTLALVSRYIDRRNGKQAKRIQGQQAWKRAVR